MADQVEPPFVERCHCHVGVGDPLVVTEKVAVCPTMTDRLLG